MGFVIAASRSGKNAGVYHHRIGQSSAGVYGWLLEVIGSVIGSAGVYVWLLEEELGVFAAA